MWIYKQAGNCNNHHNIISSLQQRKGILNYLTEPKDDSTKCCEEISDEIKEARFIIIQSLNCKEITLDIVIKYLAILSLERMNCTLVLYMRSNLCHRASYDRMTKRCRIFNDQTNRNCDVGLDVVHTSVFLKTVDGKLCNFNRFPLVVNIYVNKGNNKITEHRTILIIQSLNCKEITLDIVIKYLAILSLERMNCTLVL
jgi:transcriptional regulator of met regulon